MSVGQVGIDGTVIYGEIPQTVLDWWNRVVVPTQHQDDAGDETMNHEPLSPKEMDEIAYECFQAGLDFIADLKESNAKKQLFETVDLIRSRNPELVDDEVLRDVSG